MIQAGKGEMVGSSRVCWFKITATLLDAGVATMLLACLVRLYMPICKELPPA